MHRLYSHVAEPEDYILPAPFNVTFTSADFSAGVVMQCLNITIVNDTDVECDHDFTVGIESITPEVANDLSSTVTVTIDDSADGKPATHYNTPMFSLSHLRDTVSVHFFNIIVCVNMNLVVVPIQLYSAHYRLLI